MPLSREPLYRAISSCVGARLNCKLPTHTEWFDKHTEAIEALVEFLPSGSGIDQAPKLDYDKSTAEKLVLHFAYHHMAESGMYDGWTEHTLTVRPSLQFGISCSISGRDRNQVKDYLYESFQYALTQDVWQDAEAPYTWRFAPYADKPAQV